MNLQEIGVEVWDWDAGSDDEKIGTSTVQCRTLAGEDGKIEAWYDVIGKDGQPVWGEDGSKTIVKIVVEKNVDPSDVGIRMHNVVPDADDTKVLDCTKEPWEAARRGIMFDIENHSDYPVRIKRFWVRISRSSIVRQRGLTNPRMIIATPFVVLNRWHLLENVSFSIHSFFALSFCRALAAASFGIKCK